MLQKQYIIKNLKKKILGIEEDECQGMRMARGKCKKTWCKHAFFYYPKCDVLMILVYV